jgi:hypothetical protein
MKNDKPDEHKGATKPAEKGNERQEPRVRGMPGSFDQPVPRDEFMPHQGRPTHQTAEVPLGTGDVPEPPGGGGLPARRAPANRGESPSDARVPEARKSSAKADERQGQRRDRKAEPK